jgi:hypothetical protein
MGGIKIGLSRCHDMGLKIMLYYYMGTNLPSTTGYIESGQDMHLELGNLWDF